MVLCRGRHVAASSLTMGARRLVLLASLTILPGCYGAFSYERTEVSVHRASEVAVTAPIPKGTVTLLEAGSEIATATVPRTMPPFEGSAGDASVERRRSGSVSVACTFCDRAKEAIATDAPIKLLGDPASTIEWADGRLRMRYTQTALSSCGFGSRTVCPTPTFSILLVTPPNNVVSIRHRVTRYREPLWIGAILGSSIAAGGLAFLLTAPTVQLPESRANQAGIGAGMIIFGIPLAVLGVVGVLMKDRDEVVYPGVR